MAVGSRGVSVTMGGRRHSRLLRALGHRFFVNPRHGPLPSLLLLITVLSGLVDAVSILRMGRIFVANMTGNIAFLGFGIAGAAGISVPASATALAGFVVGAGATGWFPLAWRSDRARLLRTAAVIKLLLMAPVVAAGIVVGISPGRASTYVFSALLAMSMGIQSAAARRLAVPNLPTNVLTTTLTGIVADMRQRGVRRSLTGNAAAMIICLFGGAAIGAVVVLHLNAVTALGIGMVILVVVAVVAHRAVTSGAAWLPFIRP